MDKDGEGWRLKGKYFITKEIICSDLMSNGPKITEILRNLEFEISILSIFFFFKNSNNFVAVLEFSFFFGILVLKYETFVPNKS